MPMTQEYEYDVDESKGVYPLIRSIDKSVRELSNEFYDFRRESNSRFSALEKTASVLESDVQTLKMDTAILKNDVAELKADVKELTRNVSDISGDIRELSAKFDSVQTRFNWGLVILGLIVALIQMLK